MADLSLTTLAALAAALALGLLVWLLAGPGLAPRPGPDDSAGTDETTSGQAEVTARANGAPGGGGAGPDR